MGVVGMGMIALIATASLAAMEWPVGAIAAIGGAALAASTWCAHREASLLPPVRGAGKDRDHARWYCERCGRTWPATCKE
jgi:hypothetical protein